jgi:hypothetical protein
VFWTIQTLTPDGIIACFSNFGDASRAILIIILHLSAVNSFAMPRDLCKDVIRLAAVYPQAQCAGARVVLQKRIVFIIHFTFQYALYRLVFKERKCPRTYISRLFHENGYFRHIEGNQKKSTGIREKIVKLRTFRPYWTFSRIRVLYVTTEIVKFL